MKPPILTGEQVTGIVAKYIVNDKPYPISELGERFGRALGEVIGTQRDKDYEHEQQTVTEIFEAIENTFGWLTIDGYGKKNLEKIIVDDTGYYGEEGSLAKWQSLKSHFLEEK